MSRLCCDEFRRRVDEHDDIYRDGRGGWIIGGDSECYIIPKYCPFCGCILNSSIDILASVNPPP